MKERVSVDRVRVQFSAEIVTDHYEIITTMINDLIALCVALR